MGMETGWSSTQATDKGSLCTLKGARGYPIASDCKESACNGILKEISPGCSLEGLMLKLKLQYFGHLM